MWWSVIVVSALLAVFGAACLGGDTESNAAPEREVSNVLVGFAEAFMNGDSEQLDIFWSTDCGEPERTRQARVASSVSSVLFASLLGEGEFAFSVDSDKLVMDVAGDGRLTIPLDQPEGAVVTTFGGELLPAREGKALPWDAPINMASEDGVWRVTTCKLFVGEDEELGGDGQ